MKDSFYNDNLVSVRGVSRWFGPEQVLREVDLDLPRGSVTALMGRNGSGKSTLMRILLGLLARDSGSAQVLGRDPETFDPELLNRLAFLGDSPAAFPGARVSDELAFQAQARGARWNDTLAADLMRRFELPRKKRIRALSKGQRARLGLVLALSCEPELLLLDEPGLGLDLFARRDFLEMMIELLETGERGILITSHLIDDVERVADRVAFLRDGTIEVCGAIDELRHRFRRARVSVSGKGAPIEAIAEPMLGVRRVARDPESPPRERVIIFDDYKDSLLELIEERAGARRIELRKMSLREIYLEVLSGEEVAA